MPTNAEPSKKRCLNSKMTPAITSGLVNIAAVFVLWPASNKMKLFVLNPNKIAPTKLSQPLIPRTQHKNVKGYHP